MTGTRKESRRAIQERLSDALGINVTPKMVRCWQDGDYPLDDIDALRAKLANQERNPLKAIATEDGDAPEGEHADIEDLIRQLQSAADYDVARKLKTQIDGLKSAYQLREAAGSYVSLGVIEEAVTRICSSVKGSIMRLEADLPPMLEGLSPSRMQVIIRQKIDETLTLLSDEVGRIGQEDAE
jgi:hypothetical protein